MATTRKRGATPKTAGARSSRKLSIKKETLKDLAPKSSPKGGLITPYKPLTPSKILTDPYQSGGMSY